MVDEGGGAKWCGEPHFPERVRRGLRGGSRGGGGSLTSAGGIRRGFERKGGVTRWPR